MNNQDITQSNYRSSIFSKIGNKWKAIWKYIIIVFLLFFVVFIVLYIIFSIDESPPQDSDLLLQKVDITEQDNAYYLLKQGSEKINWPNDAASIADDIISKDAWDKDLVSEIVNDNQEALNLFSQAVQLPYFQDPAWSDPETYGPNTVLLGLSSIRDISRLNCIKAAYLFSSGYQKEAFEEALKVVQIGQMIENSQGALIHYLVGVAIKKTGLEEIQTLTSMTNLPKDDLKNIINQLEQYKDNEEGLKIVFKSEYIATKKTIDLAPEYVQEFESFNINNFMAKSSFYFHPNETKSMFANYTRQAISNIDKNYCNQIEQVDIETIAPIGYKALFTPNVFGKVIHDITAVDLGAVINKKCLDDFSVIGTQTLIAIKSYQLEKNNIPELLGELVPEYFLEIPKDPFDGNNLRYLADNKIIYSVGESFKDEAEGNYSDKPTIEIKF